MDLIFTNHFPKQNIVIPFYYKISSFTYTLGGFFFKIKSKILFHYLDFPWILYSNLLFIIGILSYISDTVYFCKSSKFVIFDRIFATIGLCLTIYLLIKQTYISFCINLFGIILSCCCKIRAAMYYNIKQYDIYFMYHTLWHICIPLFTLMSLMSVT